jgi:hypothetical protein
MSDLIRQAPALIGVAVGALASFLVTTASERNRWRREQASRWDDKRADAYAEYGNSVKNLHELCKRIAAYRGLQTWTEPLDPAEGLEDLARSAAERAAKWEIVLLLGSPAAVVAARSWHRQVWQMELFAQGVRTDNTQWRTLLDDVAAARYRFYDAARRDLGITSGQLPDSGPWEGPPGPPPSPPGSAAGQDNRRPADGS